MSRIVPPPTLSSAGEYTAHLVAAHTHGPIDGRRVKPQLYPRGLEQDYGSRLVALVHRARAAFAPVATEIPRLLARAAASQGYTPRRLDAEPDAPPGPDVVDFAGFPVVIESPMGSLRAWRQPDGRTGATVMKYDYGYIDGVVGADGEEVDVYLGPHPDAPWVFVIHQNKAPDFTSYDEDKVMLGFSSPDSAHAAYLGQYDDRRFFGGMTMLSLDGFRAALRATSGGKITHVDHALVTPMAFATRDVLRLDHDEARIAQQLLDRSRDEMERQLSARDIEILARYFGGRVNEQQAAELAKQLQDALGVDVMPNADVRALVADFATENAKLIGSVPADLHDEIAKLTARAFQKRMDPATFERLLQVKFDIAENRARAIARDQLGLLNGQLNEARQRALGITRYLWQTQEDDKVRATHRARHGRSFAWDSPPAGGVPGEDYGCRCTAIPDVSDILQMAKWRRVWSSSSSMFR